MEHDIELTLSTAMPSASQRARRDHRRCSSTEERVPPTGEPQGRVLGLKRPCGMSDGATAGGSRGRSARKVAGIDARRDESRLEAPP